jgi:hypothetical protein
MVVDLMRRASETCAGSGDPYSALGMGALTDVHMGSRIYVKIYRGRIPHFIPSFQRKRPISGGRGGRKTRQ